MKLWKLQSGGGAGGGHVAHQSQAEPPLLCWRCVSTGSGKLPPEERAARWHRSGRCLPAPWEQSELRGMCHLQLQTCMHTGGQGWTVGLGDHIGKQGPGVEAPSQSGTSSSASYWQCCSGSMQCPPAQKLLCGRRPGWRCTDLEGHARTVRMTRAASLLHAVACWEPDAYQNRPHTDQPKPLSFWVASKKKREAYAHGAHDEGSILHTAASWEPDQAAHRPYPAPQLLRGRRTRMVRMTRAASSTLRARQVRQSRDLAAGTTPRMLTKPMVALMPTQPFMPAGMRPASVHQSGAGALALR